MRLGLGRFGDVGHPKSLCATFWALRSPYQSHSQNVRMVVQNPPKFALVPLPKLTALAASDGGAAIVVRRLARKTFIFVVVLAETRDEFGLMSGDASSQFLKFQSLGECVIAARTLFGPTPVRLDIVNTPSKPDG